jgi:hypothetical protein
VTTSSLRGAWHHVALTVAGGQAAFYVDGELVHSGSGAGSASASSSEWRVMRNGSTSQYSRGLADEIAFYNTALTADTIRQHHQRGTGQ